MTTDAGPRSGRAGAMGSAMLYTVGVLRWRRPRLAADLAGQVLDEAAERDDAATWLQAAGWLLYGRAAVGDARDAAVELLAELEDRGGSGALERADAQRLRVELAALAQANGDPELARDLVEGWSSSGPEREDDELELDRLAVLVRCALVDGADDLNDLRSDVRAVGDRLDGEPAGLAQLLLGSIHRDGGAPEAAADCALRGLANLGWHPEAPLSAPGSPHLGCALLSQWVTALLEAGSASEIPDEVKRLNIDDGGRHGVLWRLAAARAFAGRARPTADVLEDAATAAAEVDAPSLEAACRSAQAELFENAGEYREALGAVRAAMAAERTDKGRARRLRDALGGAVAAVAPVVADGDAPARRSTGSRTGGSSPVNGAGPSRAAEPSDGAPVAGRVLPVDGATGASRASLVRAASRDDDGAGGPALERAVAEGSADEGAVDAGSAEERSAAERAVNEGAAEGGAAGNPVGDGRAGGDGPADDGTSGEGTAGTGSAGVNGRPADPALSTLDASLLDGPDPDQSASADAGADGADNGADGVADRAAAPAGDTAGVTAGGSANGFVHGSANGLADGAANGRAGSAIELAGGSANGLPVGPTHGLADGSANGRAGSPGLADASADGAESAAAGTSSPGPTAAAAGGDRAADALTPAWRGPGDLVVDVPDDGGSPLADALLEELRRSAERERDHDAIARVDAGASDSAGAGADGDRGGPGGRDDLGQLTIVLDLTDGDGRPIDHDDAAAVGSDLAARAGRLVPPGTEVAEPGRGNGAGAAGEVVRVRLPDQGDIASRLWARSLLGHLAVRVPRRGLPDGTTLRARVIGADGAVGESQSLVLTGPGPDAAASGRPGRNGSRSARVGALSIDGIEVRPGSGGRRRKELVAAVPADAAPGAANGGGGERGAAKPGDAELGDSELGDSELGDSEPGDSEPGDAEPADVKVGDARVDAAEPGDLEPGRGQPGGAHHAAGDGDPGSSDSGPGGTRGRGAHRDRDAEGEPATSPDDPAHSARRNGRISAPPGWTLDELAVLADGPGSPTNDDPAAPAVNGDGAAAAHAQPARRSRHAAPDADDPSPRRAGEGGGRHGADSTGGDGSAGPTEPSGDGDAATGPAGAGADAGAVDPLDPAVSLDELRTRAAAPSAARPARSEPVDDHVADGAMRRDGAVGREPSAGRDGVDPRSVAAAVPDPEAGGGEAGSTSNDVGAGGTGEPVGERFGDAERHRTAPEPGTPERRSGQRAGDRDTRAARHGWTAPDSDGASGGKATRDGHAARDDQATRDGQATRGGHAARDGQATRGGHAARDGQATRDSQVSPDGQVGRDGHAATASRGTGDGRATRDPDAPSTGGDPTAIPDDLGLADLLAGALAAYRDI